jgi:hypothetical protein
MDENSLNRLEMAALSRRLKALRQRSETDEIFYRLCPEVLDRIESDHWAFLSFLASLYSTRELQDEDRLTDMKKASGADDDDDDDWDEEDEWEDEDDEDWEDEDEEELQS